MNLVDRHPQRQQIREDILSGKSLRSVAATLNPPLHHATLARYRIQLLGVASKNMRGSNDKALEIRAIADSHRDSDGISALQERVRTELQQVAEAQEERRLRWISNAEQQTEDGQLNHRALSSHDRNLLASLELRAKLAGVLNDGTQTNTNVQVCVMMPGGTTSSTDAPAASGIAGGQVKASGVVLDHVDEGSVRR